MQSIWARSAGPLESWHVLIRSPEWNSRGARFTTAVIKLTYKYDKKVQFFYHKIRLNYPGNRLEPYVHYKPTQLAAFSPDIAEIRQVISISVRRSMIIRHVGLKAAFIHEYYSGPQLLYLQTVFAFAGSPCHTGMVARITKNICGSPNGPDDLQTDWDKISEVKAISPPELTLMFIFARMVAVKLLWLYLLMNSQSKRLIPASTLSFYET